MNRINIRALAWAIIVPASMTVARAQSDCTDFHRFNCERSSDARFKQNGQSRSALVKVGEETELNIIVYRGQDYRITVCHNEKVLGKQLAVRLVEKFRVTKGTGPDGKPLYEEVEKPLWSNTEHDMEQQIEFTCTATKRIAIEVNAPGAAERKGRNADLDIGCVGILIEHMPTPGVGF